MSEPNESPAEERVQIVTARLRYAITGPQQAEGRRTLETGVRQAAEAAEVRGASGYSVRCCGIDLNPDEVSGYTNYPTFLVAMHLSNDRQRNEWCLGQAREALRLEERGEIDERSPELWLADLLKERVESAIAIDDREADAGTDTEQLAVSLLRASFDQVDWKDIAEEWLTSAREG